jgi:hypothetical protein
VQPDPVACQEETTTAFDGGERGPVPRLFVAVTVHV